MAEDQEGLPRLTDELLKGIEWRYAVPRVCRVCGAPLQLADTQGMKMTCTSDAASPFRRAHEAAGATRAQAMIHYSASTLWNPPDGDKRVLALAAAFRAVRKLAEDALLLRQNGECAPGGDETWRGWEERAEAVLRGFLPSDEPS